MASTKLAMPSKIDIWSRGEVASYLAGLANTGQVKKCKHMRLEFGHARAFYPFCEKQWASFMPANNVPLDITAYNGPSSYSWPKCPPDCPYFDNVDNFLVSVSRDQNTESREREKMSDLSAVPAMHVPLPASPNGPPFPDRVTIRWLIQHVPVSYWVYAIGLLAGAFMLGVQSARIVLVREIFGLAAPMEVTKPAAPNEAKLLTEQTLSNSVKTDAPVTSSR